MIKMVIADMDGTLLNKELKISQRNLDAIAYLRSKQIKFCVATGRPDQLMKEYVFPLQMDEPMIMYNGSVIGHPFKEERLYENVLAKTDVKMILSYCQQQDMICMTYTKDKLISKPNYRVDFFEKRNKTLPIEQRSIFEDIRDVDTIVNEYHVQKILIIENDEEKYIKTKKMLEQYKQFTIATSQKGFLDINPKGSSKGNALIALAEYYNIALDDVIAFGDQENDISMLETAGKGIAMGNASPHVQQFADEVTASNEEDGFAVWIEQNV